MRRLLPLALVSSVLLMCGCGGSGDKDGADAPDSSESSAAANGEKKTFRIAVIPKGTSHDFWLSVRHGAETAAKELGNVEVIWKGTQKEDKRKARSRSWTASSSRASTVSAWLRSIAKP